MWLPHHLLAVVFISQLIIDTDASFGRSSSTRLWLTDGDLVEDVRASTGSPNWSGFIKLRPPRTVTPREALSYFKKKCHPPFLQTLENTQLVQKALNYLIHEDMPTEQLEDWCSFLTNKMESRRGFGVIAHSILYTYHTLLLKNIYNERIPWKISEMVKYLWERTRVPPHQPNLREELEREPDSPKLDRSSNFSKRVQDDLKKPSSDDKSLKLLWDAIKDGNTRYITYNLRQTILEIFSTHPAKSMSRVALIDMLFHLLHADRPHIRLQVYRLIELLKGENYLSDSEVKILATWLDYCRIDSATGQVQTLLPVLHAFDVSTLT
ncbi:hypothetical protein PtA15_6A812 [Puccinia triticina]|uniref:Condensin complex subunit 1 C-terminal domain-containing protein n=1 Tax=Puccinia triticina TaxID=208348 RepID=A0ABY7CQX7_9BASI|nr:uncharacterized protein PtA15_6A812 [Puccinia triticina]WAQ86180.1 hypothetical protein PtA15_6A812 [Puccinia triticina]